MTYQELHTVLLGKFPGKEIEYTYPVFFEEDEPAHEVDFVLLRPGQDEFTPAHCEGEFVAYVRPDGVEVIRI